MGHGHKSGAVSKSKWIVAGLLVFGLVVVVAVAALLPVWIVRWLGGKDFQKLASQQVSGVSFNRSSGPLSRCTPRASKAARGLLAHGSGTYKTYGLKSPLGFF
ncbi:MAG: hypothetical protein EBS60_01620 [Verrucomicrobia bacterium]|nr:hypothetical protein [Verrucomicrobiota bacterium]